MKYRVQITTLEQVQPDNAAAPPYEKQTPIYDQTLDNLDVAKVVIAANECTAKTCTAPAKTYPPGGIGGSGGVNFDARGNATSP